MSDFFDPGFLPEIPMIRQEKTFTTGSGKVFCLAMEVEAGGDTDFAIRAKAAELMAHWSAPERMVRYRVSEAMCQTIATLMIYNVQPESADPTQWFTWGFEHWANLMKRDYNTFLEVLVWVRELEALARQPEAGNVSAAHGA